MPVERLDLKLKLSEKSNSMKLLGLLILFLVSSTTLEAGDSGLRCLDGKIRGLHIRLEQVGTRASINRLNHRIEILKGICMEQKGM